MEKNPVTNKAAIAALESSPYVLTERSAVITLIKAGLLEADPVPVITDAERYAQIAKEWLSSNSDFNNAFYYASGWSTEGWEHVLKTEFGRDFSLDHNIERCKSVFAATVILAKEAGVEL